MGESPEVYRLIFLGEGGGNAAVAHRIRRGREEQVRRLSALARRWLEADGNGKRSKEIERMARVLGNTIAGIAEAGARLLLTRRTAGRRRPSVASWPPRCRRPIGRLSVRSARRVGYGSAELSASRSAAGRSKPRRYATRMPPEERREQCPDATLALIAGKGYESVSMEGIARRAGVTKPVVYDLFGSLADLLEALLEREEERALAQLAELMPAPAGTPTPPRCWSTPSTRSCARSRSAPTPGGSP